MAMTDIGRDYEARELWFIYSPMNQSRGNQRVATFVKPRNTPDLDFVVIHNEIGDRVGLRIWQDIVQSELWFKVRRIETPTMADVMKAAMEVPDYDGFDRAESRHGDA